MKTLWTALLLSIFSVSAHAMHSGQEEGSDSESTPVAARASSSAHAIHSDQEEGSTSESTPVAASASSSEQADASAGAEWPQGVDRARVGRLADAITSGDTWKMFGRANQKHRIEKLYEFFNTYHADALTWGEFRQSLNNIFTTYGVECHMEASFVQYGQERFAFLDLAGTDREVTLEEFTPFAEEFLKHGLDATTITRARDSLALFNYFSKEADGGIAEPAFETSWADVVKTCGDEEPFKRETRGLTFAQLAHDGTVTLEAFLPFAGELLDHKITAKRIAEALEPVDAFDLF